MKKTLEAGMEGKDFFAYLSPSEILRLRNLERHCLSPGIFLTLLSIK